MTASSALMAGRMAADRQMLDTVRVESMGAPVTDDDGNVTVARATVYTGQCKIGGDRPYESKPEAGGATIVVQRFTLHLPATSGPFEDGQVATILASELQPHLVGREFRIAGRDERSLQTAQRMFVDIQS